MTPAVNSAKRAKIAFQLHEYEHDPAADSYGREAASKLDIEPERVFKTLVIALGDNKLAVAIIPVSKQLNLKLFAKAVGAKKVSMAEKNAVEKSTGYVLGGVSPLGQKKKLHTVIDASARDFKTIYVSAGRRGLQIELSPDDLAALTGATFETLGK